MGKIKFIDRRDKILVTTIENIAGYEIVEVLGIVRGGSVRSKNFFKTFFARLSGYFGGDVGTYSKLLSESRTSAEKLMVQEAEKLGANAVIGVRFATSMIAKTMSEIGAYGTAVKIIKK